MSIHRSIALWLILLSGIASADKTDLRPAPPSAVKSLISFELEASDFYYFDWNVPTGKVLTSRGLKSTHLLTLDGRLAHEVSMREVARAMELAISSGLSFDELKKRMSRFKSTVRGRPVVAADLQMIYQFCRSSL